MKTKLLPSREERWDELVMYYSLNYDGREVSMLYHYFHKFLKQEPELYMFVPCDEDGNVLEKPQQGVYGNKQYEGAEWDEYQQALDRVIFDGFEITFMQDNIYAISNKLMELWVEEDTNKLMESRYKTLADLSGKVYLNENEIKKLGLLK